MFVVPLSGDKIATKYDSTPLTVSSYTNLKNDPAVYIKPGTSQEQFIYFYDIASINGVKVEFNENSKVFNALGPIKRKFNIPQPKDLIKIKLLDVPFNNEFEEIEIKSIKLHNKKYGINRGLLSCSENSCFSLIDIIDITRNNWSEKFNQKAFKKYYLDYLPLSASI